MCLIDQACSESFKLSYNFNKFLFDVSGNLTEILWAKPSLNLQQSREVGSGKLINSYYGKYLSIIKSRATQSSFPSHTLFARELAQLVFLRS